MVKEYKKQIESELYELCSELLDFIKKLYNHNDSNENQVYYLKMKGDYLRYQAEFLDEDEYQGLGEEAKSAYQSAQQIATELTDVHPLKLGLFLNMSVLYYEILQVPQEAIKIA